MAKPADAGRRAIERGHEVADVQPWGVVLVGAGLIVVLILVGIAMWGLLTVFRQDRPADGPAPTAVERTNLVPPEPRLQADPPGDARTMRAQAEAVLGSYGWVDREAGIAHIPIDEAMRLLAEHGWPSREWRER